jgi:hypothetical protein
MSSSAEAGAGPAGLFPHRVVPAGREEAHRRGALIETGAARVVSALARAPRPAESL